MEFSPKRARVDAEAMLKGRRGIGKSSLWKVGRTDEAKVEVYMRTHKVQPRPV